MKKSIFRDESSRVYLPRYKDEILTSTIKRKLYEPKLLGRLGNSPIRIGMKKIRAKRPLIAYFLDYFHGATIHGLNHLAAPRRHFFERILALLFIGGALICLVVLALLSWHRYQDEATGILLNHDYRNFNVTKLAITVCPSRRINSEAFSRVFDEFGIKDTPETRQFFDFISNATYENFAETPIYGDVSADKWLAILAALYVRVPEERCHTNAICKSDSKLDIVTEKGICTTYSGILGNYLTPNYLLSSNYNVPPLRDLNSYTFDERADRYVVNKISGEYEESIKQSSILVTYSSYISVHHPASLALANSRWYPVGGLELVELNVIIDQIDSSTELRQLSVDQRKCKFRDDAGLKLWPVYTFDMCKLECRYNVIREKCDCYPHFAKVTPGTKICNASQLRCVGNISKIVASFCAYCLPDCESTMYLESTLRVSPLKTDPSSRTSLEESAVIVDITFPRFKLQRAVFFGFNEFLVSVGGAAGLFLGASIISFVEIFYFATLRLFWYEKNLGEFGKNK